MKKQTRTLMIFGAGAALAYAISKEGSPLELPTGEGDGLVMRTQANNSPVRCLRVNLTVSWTISLLSTVRELF